MTAPRQVVPGRLLIITRRTSQRQFLLRPDVLVNAIIAYCLAEAAERYGIDVYGFIAMSNHVHVVVRDNAGNHPEFTAHFHKMVAKALNRHRRRNENFWSNEQTNVVHLVEPHDQLAKLMYVLANPVAAHLVERASDWPGLTSLQLNLSGRTATVKRPLGFFRSKGRMPEEVTLRVARLPSYEHLTDDEWRELLTSAMQREEAKARAKRLAANDRVLGRKAVLRTDPADRPNTRAPRGKLRPHLACRNPARRALELRALRGFREQHHAARLRWRAGDHEALFPIGTYRMLKLGARCVSAGTAGAPAPVPVLAN